MATPTSANGYGEILAACCAILRDSAVMTPLCTAQGAPLPALVEALPLDADLTEAPQAYPAVRVSFEDGVDGFRAVGPGPTRRDKLRLSLRVYVHGDAAVVSGASSAGAGAYLQALGVLRACEWALNAGLRGAGVFVYQIRPGAGSNRASKPYSGVYPAVLRLEGKTDIWVRAADGFA